MKNSCTKNEETKYCSTNNPSTDSGCATQVSTTKYYKCTFVAGNRIGDCTDMRETKYCSKSKPNYSSNCTNTLNITYKYECKFLNKTKITCTERNVKMQYCIRNNEQCLRHGIIPNMGLYSCSTDHNSAFRRRGENCAEFVYCQFIDNHSNYHQCNTCSEQVTSQNTKETKYGKDSVSYSCQQTVTVTCTYNGANGIFTYGASHSGKC